MCITDKHFEIEGGKGIGYKVVSNKDGELSSPLKKAGFYVFSQKNISARGFHIFLQEKGALAYKAEIEFCLEHSTCEWAKSHISQQLLEIKQVSFSCVKRTGLQGFMGGGRSIEKESPVVVAGEFTFVEKLQEVC